MTWECAECHAVEGKKTHIDAVCHHCGKLLCRDDQKLLPDLAFSAATGEIGAEAVHCRDCRHQYHMAFDVRLGAIAE